MKKLLLLICLVFTFHSSKAQLHDTLKETDWHIFHVILNGVEYPTPIVDVIGIVDLNVVFEEDISYAVLDNFRRKKKCSGIHQNINLQQNRPV